MFLYVCVIVCVVHLFNRPYERSLNQRHMAQISFKAHSCYCVEAVSERGRCGRRDGNLCFLLIDNTIKYCCHLHFITEEWWLIKLPVFEGWLHACWLKDTEVTQLCEWSVNETLNGFAFVLFFFCFFLWWIKELHKVREHDVFFFSFLAALDNTLEDRNVTDSVQDQWVRLWIVNKQRGGNKEREKGGTQTKNTSGDEQTKRFYLMSFDLTPRPWWRESRVCWSDWFWRWNNI